MKRTKRPLAAAMAAVLTFSMSVSGILLNLTAGAATVSGIKATTYNVPSWVGDYIVDDGRGARVGYDNLNQFDATIDGMIQNARVTETTENVTKLELLNQDWYMLKWTGTIKAKESGTYTLIGRKIDNGFVMKVDGKKVYEYWGGSHWFDGADDRLPSNQETFTVEAGQTYEVEAYYLEHDGGDACEIFATTTPDDVNSGSNINDAFEWNVKREVYKPNDDTGYINDLIGNGTGANGEGQGGNAGACVEANFKFDASIENLKKVATKISEPKLVDKFTDAVINDDNYLIKYEGVMIPKASGTYQFGAAKVDNGFMLKIGDQKVYEFWAGRTWNDDGSGNLYPQTIDLVEGQKYTFEAWFLETDGGQVLSLNAKVDGAEAVGLPELFDFEVDNGVAETDTQKYYESNAADGSFANNTLKIEDYKQGTEVNLDYYDNHTLCSTEVTGLTPGKVYKAAYFYNLQDVVELGWEVKFTPVEGATLQATNGDLTNGKNGYNPQRVIVVVPFKATAETTTLKMWQHGAYRSNSSLAKFAVYGADFDFGTLGYDHVFEKAPNQVTDNNAAPGIAWTPSKASVAKTDMEGTVKITGNAVVGETLTADVTGLTPEAGRTGLNYYWYAGDECRRGQDMFGSTYTVTSADIGKTISVKVMAPPLYNGVFTSEKTAAVPPVADTDTTAPKLEEAAKTDKVLFYSDFDGTDSEQLDVQGPAVIGSGNLAMARDGYLNLGTDMLKGQKNVTIEMVIKPSEIVEHAGIMGLGTNEDQNWWLIGMRGKGALKFGMRTGDQGEAGGDQPTKDEVLKVGEWTTVKYVITETSVTAYANGELLKTWDVTGQKSIGEINGDFVFGKQLKWPDPGFAGSLAELRITAPGQAPVVDKSALNQAITDAKKLYDEAVVGDQPGQYPESAKTALDTAIKAAEAIAGNDEVDQTAVSNATIALNEAVETFKKAVVPDEVDDGAPKLEALDETKNDILFHNDFNKADGLDIQGEAKLENGVVTMDNNGYINLGSDMLKNKKDITIEFVINPSKLVDNIGIMGLGAEEENWWLLGSMADGALKFGMKTNGTEIGERSSAKTDAGILKIGEWTVVKYVITETSVTVFADGKQLESWDITGQKTMGEIPGDFVFGKQLKWPDPGFSGSVAELRISTPKDQPTVDKTALEKAITDAKAVYDAAVVGDKPGQYPEAAKTALDAAIKAAEGVASSDADQNAINNAVTELNNAVATFKAAVIPEPGKSDAKDITSFKLGGVDAKIDGTTITAELPAGTDLTNVAAEATVSEKATISPDPATVKDFSKEVKFTVTAEDGSTKEYTVKATVKQEEKPEGTIIVEATGDKYTGGKDEGTVDGTSLTFGPGTGGNREFMCPDLPGLEVGKVYKAAVYLTMSEVAAQDWTIKVRPQHEYYFLTRNDLMYDADKGGDQKVIIVVPFKATSDKANVNCVLEGFTGSIDRVVIATNDYDFGKDQGEYVLKSEYGYQDLKNVTEPTARPAYAGSALADGDPGEKGVGWIPSTIGGEEPDEVNKDALNKAITDAKALFDKAEVGDKAGQYPQAAKDALDQAIKAAQGVADNADADQKAVDEAAATLNKAVETFKAAVIKDTSDPDNNDPDDNNSDVDNNPDDSNTPDDNTPDDNTTPDDNNTPNDNNNPVTGAAGIAMGTLILAAAAGVTLVVSKKRK